MATPSEKLADALNALHALQEKGMVAINTNDISTVYRQRLTKNGFLKEVLKGWYIPSSPYEMPGDSTSWYANYWGRFMMNVMMSSGGYPCTVIPVERRTEYMRCLEIASVTGDITSFAKFIAELVQLGMDEKPAATLDNIN